MFFVTSIQFVACALRENVFNQSSEVQLYSFWALFVLYEVQLDNNIFLQLID